ncbi:hypothetical protein HPB50_011402 [Hyalomma asiaticum]|uniref:Uncharacterized protein n=1 Tax=Hyalomma asiaticum TaxID=266040 RepID=A0ACB7TGZ0_HYAAI|nr:hypothetical protein HPB50_011402 [Hyalomma asiaticum]
MPKLPKEEIKIVVRPQGGLDFVKVGAPTVTAAIFAAAGITAEETDQTPFQVAVPQQENVQPWPDAIPIQDTSSRRQGELGGHSPGHLAGGGR